MVLKSDIQRRESAGTKTGLYGVGAASLPIQSQGAFVEPLLQCAGEPCNAGIGSCFDSDAPPQFWPPFYLAANRTDLL